MNRKQLLMILVIVVVSIIISIAVFSKPIVRFWYESTVNATCLEEKQHLLGSNYTLGHIVVYFRSGVTENQAMALANKYGLLLVYRPNISSRVYFTPGNEHKWLCILESSDIVDRTFLNHNLTIQTGDIDEG